MTPIIYITLLIFASVASFLLGNYQKANNYLEFLSITQKILTTIQKNERELLILKSNFDTSLASLDIMLKSEPKKQIIYKVFGSKEEAPKNENKLILLDERRKNHQSLIIVGGN
jgi:CRISPR/Cas system-associated protein Csx1